MRKVLPPRNNPISEVVFDRRDWVQTVQTQRDYLAAQHIPLARKAPDAPASQPRKKGLLFRQLL